MSGDVQPRKRKDKRKKKGSLDARRSEEYLEESSLFRRQSSAASDEEEFVHHGIGSSDEVIHIHKESKLGGNVFAKIVFFGLLGAIGVMVGLIIFEYHGTNDVDTASAVDSPWSVMLEGWVDNSPDEHEHGDEHGGGEHDEHDEHDDHDHDHDEEHDEHDHEYSEGDHEHEEETEEETEDEAYVKQTYEELRAAYTQSPADEGESDIDITEESNVKSTEYGTTESEPEASEPEEEEDEDVLQEDEPVPQWKSESGPELLAEEVEEVQTGSETEEESEEEPTPPTSGGPKSVEAEEENESEDFVDENIPEPVVNTNEAEEPEPEDKEESAEYEKADVTNTADWGIREELDEAERDLDEGDFLL